MRRYRKGDFFRLPTAAESAAHADAVESYRRSPAHSQDLSPVGQGLVVKTPEAGIDARDGTTISSAVCTRCIETDDTSSKKKLVDTDEEVVVYNICDADVPGDSYVETALTSCGTRYVLDSSAVHFGKLNSDLTYNSNTGVTVTIWTGKPATVTNPARTIDNVVICELWMTSGQLDSGDFVKIERIGGKWFVTGAAC